MADEIKVKMSEFAEATQVNNADDIIILQNGENKKVKSPVLESKIITRTVEELSKEGGVSLNLVNLKGVVATYANLPTTNLQINDAYQVTADGLVYVWNGTAFQPDGQGIKVQPNVNGVVIEGNTNAVSGGEVFKITSKLVDTDTNWNDIPLTKTLGYYFYNTGIFTTATTIDSTQLIKVEIGDVLKINGRCATASMALITKFDNSQNYIGSVERGVAEGIDYNDYNYVSDFSGYISIAGAINTTVGTVSKVEKQQTTVTPKFPTLEQVEVLFAPIESEDYNTLNKTTEGAIEEISNDLYTNVQTIEELPLTVINDKFYTTINGTLVDNTEWKCTIINVLAGEKYLITGNSRPTTTQLIAKFNNSTYVGGEGVGNGTLQSFVDYEFIVPDGVTSIGVTSLKSQTIKIKKVENELRKNFITQSEADNRYEKKSNISKGTYGLVWDENDANDLGTRIFDADGLNATIGIGSSNGQSDFDNIYPWSNIRRCNISINSAGARIVTYEGESGFNLDGSNGDVFVEIPKFATDRYNKDGLTYLTVSAEGNIHPAFIEKGKELDFIYVSAFEGSMYGGNYSSVAGLIPESNKTNSEFFNLCTSRGRGYTQFDMRTVDLLWSLMAVEFGSRNSNSYLGYGLADFMQPIKNTSLSSVENTTGNVFKIPKLYPVQTQMMPEGTICTICEDTQENIVAQRVITDITSDDNYTYITFDGAPVVITTDSFIGSGGQLTNWTETCSSPLSWHTGRGGMSYSIVHDDTINPCRYRWIENPIGNLWHHLAGVTFNNGQMYVCDNIEDYEPYKITAPYRPVSKVYTIQSDNGNKADIRDVNFWIKNLNTDPFARGYSIGVNWDLNRISTEGYGAYYYVRTGLMSVVHGGGFDHLWRCNILTQRAWIDSTLRWYLYGSRLIFKPI